MYEHRLTLVRRLSLLCAVTVLAACVVYLTSCIPIVRVRSPTPDVPLQDNYSDEPTRILYLTQTEECCQITSSQPLETPLHVAVM